MFATSFDSFFESGRGGHGETSRGARGGGIGDIIIGGSFTVVLTDSEYNFVHRIVAYDFGSSSWGILGSGTGLNNIVRALTIFNDNLIIGGLFVQEQGGGIDLNRICGWDRSDYFAIDDGMDGVVFALQVFDGKLYAGGTFSNAGGSAALKIASIADLGDAEWQSLGTGITGSVGAMTVYDDALVMGGSISDLDGTSCSGVVSWDGSAVASTFGTGLNGRVDSLSVHNGLLVAAGIFDDAGGVPVEGAAYWNGSAWNDMSNGMSVRNSMPASISYKNDILIGGNFRIADDTNIRHFAIYDAGADSWSGLGTNPSPDSRVVQKFYESPGGTLYTVGSFDEINGVSVRKVASSQNTTTFIYPFGEAGIDGSGFDIVEFENSGATPVAIDIPY